MKPVAFGSTAACRPPVAARPIYCGSIDVKRNVIDEVVQIDQYREVGVARSIWIEALHLQQSNGIGWSAARQLKQLCPGRSVPRNCLAIKVSYDVVILL